MNDLKFAIRQLLKNPGFTAVAVLTFALGIGVTSTVFSVVENLPFSKALLQISLPPSNSTSRRQPRADKSKLRSSLAKQPLLHCAPGAIALF